MTDLKAELEILIKRKALDQQDHETIMQEVGDRIAALEQQIAEEEATYSIGDRFKDEEGFKCILGSASQNEVIMIGLKKGYRYSEPVSVSGYYRISQAEFYEKFSDCRFTRYWDNRKQEKC